MVSRTGVPMLADFGISHSLARDSLPSTSFGAKGTVRWMARELFDYASGGPSPICTKKSDIWSLGMTIYVRTTLTVCVTLADAHFQELLTLKVPYHTFIREAEVMFAISKGTLPIPPDQSSSGGNPLYNDLWEVCEACWNEDSRRRPSAPRLLRALQKCKKGHVWKVLSSSKKGCVIFYPWHLLLTSST